MRNRRELGAALIIVATALGADFASGRESATFYAQMARASWPGVIFAAAVFGAIIATVCWLQERSAASNLFALLRHSPGGAMGWLGCALYAGILLLAGGSLIGAAGRLGELALPLRHARAFGIALTLVPALWLALGYPGKTDGETRLRAVSALFLVTLALYVIAQCFTKLGSLPGMPFVLELTLADSLPAALLFAALHAAMCASLGAGMALRAVGKGARPGRVGICSGALFLALNLAANAALRAQMDELLALDVPFVAVASEWGAPGFWLSAIVIYLAAVTSLAGLLAGLHGYR